MNSMSEYPYFKPSEQLNHRSDNYQRIIASIRGFFHRSGRHATYNRGDGSEDWADREDRLMLGRINSRPGAWTRLIG